MEGRVVVEGTCGAAYPHAGLGEVGPHGDLFARTHVGVAIPLKGRLQLLQLLAGEVRALPPLLLLQRAVFGGAAGQRNRGLLRIWEPGWGLSQHILTCADSLAAGTSCVGPSLTRTRAPTPGSHPVRDGAFISPTPRRGRAHRCALGPCSRVRGVGGGGCPHLTARGPGSGPLPRSAGRTPSGAPEL